MVSQDDDRLREDYYYGALAFSRHSINLEFYEETMKPEKATEAPRSSGIDPSTMKMKQWYQRHDRVSDKKAPTGTDTASYQARESIEGDEERLAMRQGDVPPPVPERVARSRIREDRAVQDFQCCSEKVHSAAYEDAYTRAWLDYCRSVFPQSVLTFTTCQRTSAASSSTTWVPSTGKVNFGKLRTCTSRFLQMKSSMLATILSCSSSETSGETAVRM